MRKERFEKKLGKLKMTITEMTIDNYDEVMSLWKNSDGVGLDKDTDTKPRTSLYLQRNPGLSFVALDKKRIVAAVLCGHDGRRGYMHHLAVSRDYQKTGIGRALVERVLGKLRQIGIRKCNIHVFDSNEKAKDFYKSLGWEERDNLKVTSKSITF